MPIRLKIQLPSVTLLILDCINPQRANDVLTICTNKVDFGAVKLLTHEDIDSPYLVKIPVIKEDNNQIGIQVYSVFCMTELYKYIDTEHVLIVQRDGFVLNPEAWDIDWLQLDYLAPLFVQYDIVGSGGFSLRSKKIMEYAASLFPEWDGTTAHALEIQKSMGMFEDGVLSMDKRFGHFKKGTLEQASRFGHGGNRNSKYFVENPFGFHRTFAEIDFKTGRIDYSDTSKDLTPGYDHEIEKLVYGLSTN